MYQKYFLLVVRLCKSNMLPNINGVAHCEEPKKNNQKSRLKRFVHRNELLASMALDPPFSHGAKVWGLLSLACDINI